MEVTMKEATSENLKNHIKPLVKLLRHTTAGRIGATCTPQCMAAISGQLSSLIKHSCRLRLALVRTCAATADRRARQFVDVKDFVQHCTVPADPDDSVGASELFGAFRAWRRFRGRVGPFTQKAFGQSMVLLGYVSEKAGLKYYYGLAISPGWTDRMKTANLDHRPIGKTQPKSGVTCEY